MRGICPAPVRQKASAGSRARSGSKCLPAVDGGRFGLLSLRSGTFIADRPKLDRARSFALLAPVPLSAGQTFPRAAIVANKNFFSHANLVSTWDGPVCQEPFRNTAAAFNSYW